MSLRQRILDELSRHPATAKQLRKQLGSERKVDRLLEELLAEGAITRHGAVYAEAKSGAVGTRARIVKVAGRFGFASTINDDGTPGYDIFIPGKFLMGAMPGDEVLLKITPSDRGEAPDGVVLSIDKRDDSFVGVLAKSVDGSYIVYPDVAPKVPIVVRKSCLNGAMPGEKVAFYLETRGTRHQDHEACIEKRFGNADRAKWSAESILYENEVRTSFPKEVQAEAAIMPTAISEADTAGREDFRHLPIFTIDGAHTKDIDDAISAERTEGGYRLGVHIADVSHYVRLGSALDKEAFLRGTSIYYADQVVPMLPKQLSNGICSLNPAEDRLAFSCIMEMSHEGEITSYRFVKSVIRSRLKGVYDEVNDLLQGRAGEEMQKKYGEVSAVFPVLVDIFEQRFRRRAARGSTDIESHEAEVITDENGDPVDIQRRTQGLAEQMIEEYMLAANECAANLGRVKEIPFVYRVHDAPPLERAAALKELLIAVNVPYHFAKETPTSIELAEVLDGTKETPLELLVHSAVLRAMSKAMYSIDPKGHFGLALADYAHFTSPIRRYPDLAIHRVLTAYVQGKTKQQVGEQFGAYASESAKQSTRQELVAQKVERACESCYKAAYMRQFIGQRFTGVVSGITPHGLFIELPNTVEGYITLQNLTDGQVRVQKNLSLVDIRSGKEYKLGDTLEIAVASVNVPQGYVDFKLPDQTHPVAPGQLVRPRA